MARVTWALGVMDLDEFRKTVDSGPPGIRACGNEPEKLCAYAGLDATSYQQISVNQALAERMKATFAAGHAEVWRTCQSLHADLIREHVLNGAPLDPYFQVLSAMRDGIRTEGDPRAEIDGDWTAAIRTAVDIADFSPQFYEGRLRLHQRELEVARAAKALQDNGFPIRLAPGWISLTEESEPRAIQRIEDLVVDIGGLNVARRIFAAITPVYDAVQQRYHLTPSISHMGSGTPQIPWGYLVQLAAKHLTARGGRGDPEQQWLRLVNMSKAVAAVFDVQPYSQAAWAQYDAIALVPYLQQLAQYDSLFRMPQMRASDVDRVIRGALDWHDFNAVTPGGWSLNQVLEIAGVLQDPARDVRGPILFDESEVRKACPGVPRETVTLILDEVLAHPPGGANRNFSHPSDAPLPGDPSTKNRGLDFFRRPLLRLGGRRFVLLDKSLCAPAFLEAVLTPLRDLDKGLDDKVGHSIERFLTAEFAARNIASLTGDYDVGGDHGEVDLAVEAGEAIVLFELKKKALTRTAKVGNDAALLIDLAGSLLAAQVQAGWHQVRLAKYGHLDLTGPDGVVRRLETGDREVERVAVSLLDYGSFQDRILLKQFLEATLNASFAPSLDTLKKKFDALNVDLASLRDQTVALYPQTEKRRLPFFNCWFLSVPQILLMLDDASDVESFKAALWSTRFFTTGRSDFCADYAYVKVMRAAAPAT